MTIHRSVLAISVLLFSVSAFAGMTVKKNIVYDQVNGESLKLDLYTPAISTSSPFPLIVYTQEVVLMAAPKTACRLRCLALWTMGSRWRASITVWHRRIYFRQE